VARMIDYEGMGKNLEVTEVGGMSFHFVEGA
jgi:hypothetical protein